MLRRIALNRWKSRWKKMMTERGWTKVGNMNMKEA
jgi:hypothetical protein